MQHVYRKYTIRSWACCAFVHHKRCACRLLPPWYGLNTIEIAAAFEMGDQILPVPNRFCAPPSPASRLGAFPILSRSPWCSPTELCPAGRRNRSAWPIYHVWNVSAIRLRNVESTHCASSAWGEGQCPPSPPQPPAFSPNFFLCQSTPDQYPGFTIVNTISCPPPVDLVLFQRIRVLPRASCGMCLSSVACEFLHQRQQPQQQQLQ